MSCCVLRADACWLLFVVVAVDLSCSLLWSVVLVCLLDGVVRCCWCLMLMMFAVGVGVICRGVVVEVVVNVAVVAV